MEKFKHKWEKVPRPAKIVVYVVLGAAGIVLCGFLFGYLIMVLWNWLMPEIFGWKEITYWQGMGLFVLARFLVGSFGGDKSKDEKKRCGRGRYEEWWQSEGEKSYRRYVEKGSEPDGGETPE